MKTSLEKVNGLQRKLNIEVPAQVVADSYNRVLRDIQKSATIKGFRQGKAPMETIKSVYGDRAKQDVVQDLVQKHYYAALKELKINPISYPEFEFDAPADDKDFAFSAFFEIKPEVKLNKYEGLSVEIEKMTIDTTRVDKVIENIQNSRGKMVEIPIPRASKLGDHVQIDFTGYMDGALMDRGSGTDFMLELGGGQFIPGFEEGVVGMSIGEAKTISLTFPENYQAAELAGKPVEFKVTVKAIKMKQLPEVNDEFVASLGGESKTVSHLRETIAKDLESSEKQRIQSDLKNRLLKALVKINPVEVPASLMKDQKAALIEDTRKRMQDQGMGEEEFSEYITKWDSDFENTASEIIQSSFLVDSIAEQEKLHWTKEDVEKKMEEYAQQTGIEIDKIKNYYQQSDQQRRLTYMITEEKVIAFLHSKAQLVEVDAKNLSDKN